MEAEAAVAEERRERREKKKGRKRNDADDGPQKEFLLRSQYPPIGSDKIDEAQTREHRYS